MDESLLSSLYVSLICMDKGLSRYTQQISSRNQSN